MEHIVHLLENATSEIYSQATPLNIVLAAHERWGDPAYDVRVVTVYLHNFLISQARLIFPSEVIFSLFLRLTLLADRKVSPDAPFRRRKFEQSHAR